MIQPPQVDARKAADIAAQLRKLLPRYVPAGLDCAQDRQLTNALVHVFSRFGEILIDRLNKAPEKNFLAFLDLLGVSNLPQQGAMAPLTFYLSAGSAGYAVVPPGTQVAGQPLKGEQQPVIFETERELVVVAAKLESLVAKDGGRDEYADLSCIVPQAPPPTGGQGAATPVPGSAAGKPAYRGDQPIPHLFYIGLNIFSPSPVLDRLVLHFAVEEGAGPARASAAGGEAAALHNGAQTASSHPIVIWELCTGITPASPVAPTVPPVLVAIDPDDGVIGVILTPAQDGTENLTKTGDVIFEKVALTDEKLQKVGPALAGALRVGQKTGGVDKCPLPVVAVQGTPQWLRCRLVSPIDSGPVTTAGRVRAADLPRIKQISAEFQVSRQDLRLEQAYFNNQKLDLSKDFYPFGERPKFGDVLYLSSQELFSNPDAEVSLHIELTNPMSGGAKGPIPATAPHSVKLSWEFWDGCQWYPLGVAGSPIQIITVEVFSDTTKAFAESGDVKFKFPAPPQKTTVSGQAGFWIRARIVAGNYGREVPVDKEHTTVTVFTYSPPAIHAISSSYSIQKQIQPQALLSYNDFAYTTINVAETFLPFSPVAANELPPGLYLGFTPPASAQPKTSPSLVSLLPRFPNRSMSIYASVDESITGRVKRTTSEAVRTPATWEYWNGSTWTKWTVRDDTDGFCHSGLIRFLAPPDFVARREFGLERYWLRVRPGDAQVEPRLCMVLLNTTLASNGTTSTNEALGVSNGTPEQSFLTMAKPILEGQQLQVLEPRMPDYSGRKAIKKEEGEDAILTISQEAGHEQIWVRWHEVANFYSSGPRDRHYVLDRLTGVVTFGDGENGQIPPRGGNIRMAQYRAGGGAVGNRPAFNISQLKTAVPYIDKVCNWVAAGGGGDTEPTEALLERGSRGVRHGGRAVTREDFEDLARLASPEVAKAKCIPLQDLAQDTVPTGRRPGVVSVIVVPRSTEPRPVPNSILLGCVRQFLERCQPPTARVVAVGPAYVRVDVWTDVAVEDPDTAADVELAVKLELGRYLHPLTGGRDGRGWAFGRRPHKSDLYALIESVAGVSHVRDIRVQTVADRRGLEKTERFLICGGNFSVVTSLED